MSACSLLVPCHDGARFLPRLWGTVAGQTVPFGEWLVYDDASHDSSAEVAAQLGATVIRGSRRRGPAYARNQLLEAASCTWVHFHDADDLLDPCFLERATASMANDVDAIIADVDWLDEHSGDVLLSWSYSEEDLKRDPLNATIAHPIGGINGVYRREVLRGIGGFDEAFACWEDADLHVRLAAQGARFTALGEVLCYALRREGSLSADQVRCHYARLQLLCRYAEAFPARVYPAIAGAAQKVAAELLRARDGEGARRAMELCARLGYEVPITRSRALRLIKRVLPPGAALSLQQRAHRLLQSAARAGTRLRRRRPRTGARSTVEKS